MPAMRTVGAGHQLSPRVQVRRDAGEYVIQLDVSDFTEPEVSIEALGPCITVRGEQVEIPEDEGRPFRLHERLEESFRLPDDADPDRIRAFYRHHAIQIHAPRTHLETRLVPIECAPSFAINPDAEPS
jgi:HSP20 family molecular chaperone IbpA